MTVPHFRKTADFLLNIDHNSQISNMKTKYVEINVFNQELITCAKKLSYLVSTNVDLFELG